MRLLGSIAIVLLLTTPLAAAPGDEIAPRRFPLPERTEWRPEGCRAVPFTHPALLPRTAFRRAHGDLDSSDEVELAYAPVFEREWIAEPSLYQVTTPSFDGAGNLYMTPLLPHEPILMISLDPETGARRFVVPLEPGQRGGGVVPLVLRDPDTATDVVYVNSYSRVLAVRGDGTVLWDVPTGLGAATTAEQSPIGLAWVPSADAIVGQTRDGFVFLFDRRTGSPLLDTPLQLPGERTSPRENTIPASLAASVDDLLRPLVAFTPGRGVLDLIQVLLGGNSEVANNLSVDPRRDRLWIAATAPDGEDGDADGVSQFGAIYRYDLVQDGGAWELVEVCHRSFSGGSASTPTLDRGGDRIYLGDDAGALIAIDAADCGEAWTVPLDSQIFGSVAAASDGRELFAASARGVFQIFDEGDHGRRGWTAALDLYDVPAELSNYGNMNLLLAGVGANGLLIHTGVGLTGMQSLPVRTGIAHVDRLTGEPRWFADGLEESLGAMSTGPDGALYLPHAPLRRAFALALGLTDEPLVGGVGKWSARRHDLLARDAACAAADRAANASAFLSTCPDSAAADVAQVDTLRSQLLDAASRAHANGELDEALLRQVEQLAAALGPPPDPATRAAVGRYHRRAAETLGRACSSLGGGEVAGDGDACPRQRVPSLRTDPGGSAGSSRTRAVRDCPRALGRSDRQADPRTRSLPSRASAPPSR